MNVHQFNIDNIKFPIPFAKGKHICPSCGVKKFVKYNPPIPEHFGKCERIGNCGYELIATVETLKKEGVEFAKIERREEKPISWLYPKQAIIDAYLFNNTLTNFHTWAQSIGIPQEHLDKWNVKADKHGNTVFLFKNREGQWCNYKIGEYNAEGKRNKDRGFYTLKAKSETEKYMFPLFGEHLLTKENKQQIVCVVESEKTAIVASHFYPEFVWIAASSANGLSTGENGTNDRVSPLIGRRVWWLCDADKAGRSNTSLRNLEKFGITHQTLDLFPQLTDGSDIADFLAANKNKPRLEFFDLEVGENGSTYEPKLKFVMKPREESQTPTPKSKKNAEDNDNPTWAKRLHQGVDRASFEEYNFYEYNGKLYFLVNRNNVECLSNFTIRVLFLVRSKANPKRVVEITNVHGKTVVIDLDINDLISVSRFKLRIESEGNFLFEGKEEDLGKLKRKLFAEEEEVQEVGVLGHQPNNEVFAWANGISVEGQFIEANTYGIVKHNKKAYFLPAMSSIYADDAGSYVNEKKFKHIRSSHTFTEWSELFCKVYNEGNNGRIGVLFYVCALFRDIVQARLSCFPLLFASGVPMAGKNQFCKSVMYMFGEPQDQFALGNAGTAKGMMRTFATFCDSIVFLDEYKNSIDSKFIEMLKNLWDSIGYVRAMMTQDYRTQTTPINSAAIIAGQELPTADSALTSRVILLEFKNTSFTPEAVQLFTQLKEWQLQGLSSITTEVHGYRNLVKDGFADAQNKAFADLRAVFTAEDRITTNASVLLAIYRILKDKLKFPFTEAEVIAMLKNRMERTMNLMGGSKDTHKFWEMVAFLVERGDIKEEVDFNVAGDSLYINLTKIFPLYSENFPRQHNGARGLDKQTLTSYLTNSPEYRSTKASYRFPQGKNTSAYVFEYPTLLKNGIVLTDVEFGEVEEKTKTTEVAQGGQNEVNLERNYDELDF
jgi:hypothetical protein